MNGRNFYSYLFVGLCILSLTTHSLAQTITTGSFTPTSLCSGGPVTVPFTITGPGAFSAGNTFSAQLSDGSGTFPASPTVIGSITSTTAGSINATIPASIANGSYKIRVVSSNPVKIGSISTQTLTINVPSAPGTNPVGYCVGQTPVPLTASASGGTLNWYGTAATGGTSSPNAPTPSTTAVSSITYYVSQTSPGGCESPRASLVVNVTSAPAAPTATTPAPYCQDATATVLTASGSNLKWYDASNNLLGGAPTPSTSKPGPTTYYVTQSTGNCESPKTAIIVTVNAAPAAPATTTAPTYCQNQSATPLIATASTGATLNWYGTSSSGGVASTTANTPNTNLTGPTNYYVSQTLNGCESPRAAITVVVNSIPGSPSVSNVSYCQNSGVNPLVATASTGATLNWYGTAATGGTASSVAPTPSTASTGPTTYYVSQSINGCEGPRTSVTVIINAIPAPPIAQNPAYCLQTQDQPTQNVLPLTATGQNLRWYNTDGTPLPSAPTPAINLLNTTIYQVSQTVNGCESAKTNISATVRSSSAPTVANPVISYCQSEQAQPLEATGETGGSLRWINLSGVVSATAPTPSTGNVSIIPDGDNFYVYQIGSLGCYSARTTIKVKVKSKPVAPSVNSVNTCQNSNPITLAASASSGGTLIWYGTDANGGTASTATPSVSISIPGSTTYYVGQTIDGCEGPRASLVVTVNAIPAAPGVSDLTYCLATQDQPAQNVGALTASGTGLKWYNADGSVSTTAPTPSITSVSTQTYQVSQTVNSCDSPKATIQVTVRTTAVPTVSNTTPSYCQQAPAQPLDAVAESGASLRWITLPSALSTTAPTPPTTAAGNQGYAVYQIGQNGCYSQRISITVTVKALPAAPGVAAIGFCNNATASQLSAIGTSLKWYDATDNLLGAAPTPGTGTVGDQIFKVSQTTENCEGPKANLVVTIKPLPGAPGVSNLNYCLQTQDQAFQNIVPLTASGQNLSWFNPDGNQYPIAPTPSNTALGTQTYQVSQTVNGCGGPKATIQVTIGTTAVPTITKPLVTYCINESAVPLQATAEAGASLRWVDPYGNITAAAPTPSTLNTSVQAGGDAFYVFQIGQNSCYSARSVVKVIVNALPTLSLITPTNNINLGQRVALQLKFTSIAPFSYTLTNGLTGVVNKNDTTISLLLPNTTTYQIISVKNSCGAGLPGSPSTATITVRIPTVTTSALTTSTLCAGTSLDVPFTTTGDFNQGNQFRIELVSVADTSKKYAVPTSSMASPVTSPVPLTMVGGQYYVRVKADNPEIAIIGTNSPTLLTVRPQASATLTGTQNIYEGYPANLTLTFGGEGPWTATVADSVRSYSAVATTSPYALEVRPTRNTTYRLVSVANGCGNGPVSGTVTVTVLPLLGIEDNSLDPLVKTYPVPATSTITVELDLPLIRDPATLSLTDMSGRPVLQQTTRNKKQELDLTTQPNGIYLLRIQVGDRQTVRKVLKQ